MQDLITSMVRFSTAVTLFGMQQMQNAMSAATDSQAALKNLRDALDSVTDAISSQLDESKKPTLDSVSNLGTEVVNRTWETMNVGAIDPRNVVDSAGDLMRKTSDSLNGILKKAAGAGASSSGEPQPASEILTAN